MIVAKGKMGIDCSGGGTMWCYGLLGTPVWGLVLFYLLPFELALPLYLLGVCLAFWLYDWLAVRQSAVR